MNLLQIKFFFVFILVAPAAPQLRHNLPAHNSDPLQLLTAADHQAESGFSATPRSARLTFDVSRLTLHNPDSAVIATQLKPAIASEKITRKPFRRLAEMLLPAHPSGWPLIADPNSEALHA